MRSCGGNLASNFRNVFQLRGNVRAYVYIYTYVCAFQVPDQAHRL